MRSTKLVPATTSSLRGIERLPSSVVVVWSSEPGEEGWYYMPTWGRKFCLTSRPLGPWLGRRISSAKLHERLEQVLSEDFGRERIAGRYQHRRSTRSWRLWRLRPGKRIRHGAPTTPRTLRATDAQVASWRLAAGGRPWSSWATEVLDAAAEDTNERRRQRARRARGRPSAASRRVSTPGRGRPRPAGHRRAGVPSKNQQLRAGTSRARGILP